jgi:flagellar hook-length control protein FliK
MTIPVLNSSMSPTRSATGADASRGSENALKLSFPDLLRGQLKNGVDNGTPSSLTPPRHDNAEPSRPATTAQDRKSCARDPKTSVVPAPERQPANAQDTAPASPAQADPAAKPADAPPPENGDDGTEVDLAADSGDPAQEQTEAAIGAESPKLPTHLPSLPPPSAEVDPEPSAAIAHLLPATIAAPGGETAAADESSSEEEAGGKRSSGKGGRIFPPIATDSASGKSAAKNGGDLALKSASLPTLAASASATSAGAAIITQAAPADPLAARPAGSAQSGTPTDAASTSLGALRSPTQTTSASPQIPVSSPAGQRAWAEEVGNRVMWMLGTAQSKAELVLTPPSLGKVEVSITLNGDQTTAQFIASSQAARDALEQAMPRLRELLAQAGISLGQADVDTAADGETQGEARAENSRRITMNESSDDDDERSSSVSTNWIRQNNGLINTFA